MRNIEYNHITKDDFKKIDEKNVMFITNPEEWVMKMALISL